MKINPRTVSAKGKMKQKIKIISRSVKCFPVTGDRVYCLGYFNVGKITV